MSEPTRRGGSHTLEGKLVVRFETLEKHSTNVSVERKLLTQTLVSVIVRIGSLADTSVSYRLESTLHRNVYAVHDVAESTPSLLRVYTFIYMSAC